MSSLLTLMRPVAAAAEVAASSVGAAVSSVTGSVAPVSGAGGVQFTVASWNILARAYEQWVRFPSSPAALERWPARAERVLCTLESAAAASSSGEGKRSPPSIICMQEVDEFEAVYRARLEKLGYTCLFTSRSGVHEGPPPQRADDALRYAQSHLGQSPSPAEWAARLESKRRKHDGALIAWQRDVFELDEDADSDGEAGTGSAAVHRIDYDDLAFADAELKAAGVGGAGNSGGTAGGSSIAPSYALAAAQPDGPVPPQPDIRLLRHNVGAFVFLRPKHWQQGELGKGKEHQPLVVACTHLFYNQADLRLRQLQYLLARMRAECARRIARSGGSVAASATPADPSVAPSSGSSAIAAAPTVAAAAHVSSDPLSSFPLVLCGDFNSLPDSSVYSFATEGARRAAKDMFDSVPPGADKATSNSTGAGTPAVAALADGLASMTLTPGGAVGEMNASSKCGRALTRMEQLQLASRIAAGFPCLEVNDGASLCLEGRAASLRSAYAVSLGAEPAFSNIDGEWRGCLDYIFFNDPHPSAHRARVQTAEGPASQAIRPVEGGEGNDVAAVKVPSSSPNAGYTSGDRNNCCTLVVEGVRPVTDGSGLDLAHLTQGNCPSEACVAAKAPALAAGFEPFSRLPNEIWPSDHLMLLAYCTLGFGADVEAGKEVAAPMPAPAPKPANAAAAVAAEVERSKL